VPFYTNNTVYPFLCYKYPYTISLCSGRRTASPGGCHPIQTNGALTPIIPPFYTGCPSCCNPPNLSLLGTGTDLCWLAYRVAWSACVSFYKDHTNCASILYCIASYLSKVAHFNPPHLHLTPPLAVTPEEFYLHRLHLWLQKTRVHGLFCGSVSTVPTLSHFSTTHYGWRRGVVVNARRAQLQLGLVTVFERVYHLGL